MPSHSALKMIIERKNIQGEVELHSSYNKAHTLSLKDRNKKRDLRKLT